ncbi:hypothetical protein [Sinorhizobium sp. KGO-5]|uniref:hypothetical protein n=1 Tax=Sinorhizobium sp. KGO-5 TaxID=1470810 RepID=UPI0030C6D7F0
MNELFAAIAPAIQSLPATTCVSAARPLQIAFARSNRDSYELVETSRHSLEEELLQPANTIASAIINPFCIDPPNRAQIVLSEAVDRYGIKSVLGFRDAFDLITKSIRDSIEAAKKARAEWISAIAGGTNVQDIISGSFFTENGRTMRTADFMPRNPGVPTSRPNIELSGDGQASLAMIAHNADAQDQQTAFPYGAPSPSVEIDGAYCWDFRDPAQDPEDPSTWTWTRNSANICAWHLCFNEFGFGLDYKKALLPVIDLWKEEADICDEDVPLAGGGTEKRYQCNGWDTTENGPKSGLNAILATCDGHLVARGDGARILTVGKFRDSRTATLTDADIVGHNVQYGVLFEDECNRLVPKFTYPATNYTSCDTDFFEDTDAQIAAGRVLTMEGSYEWCHQWRQARRLGKRDWLRQRQEVKGSLDVRLSGINAVYARWVRLETPKRLPKLDGKLIENRRSIVALTKGGFTMDFIEHPEGIDDWNPATDEGQQPPVPLAVNASDIPTPVINLIQAKANGGSVYIRVVIIDPEDGSLTPVVRYRVADADGLGTPGAWVEQQNPNAEPSGGYIDLSTGNVPTDEVLDVQAAFIASNRRYSNWSVTETVTSTSDPTPPAALTSFTLTGSAPRLGNAGFAFSTGNDAHVRTVNIYRVPSGSAFDADTATLAGTRAVGPSASYAFTDGDTTRTNMLTNSGFDTDSDWAKGTGWTISGGKANKAAGTQSGLTQAPSFVAGTVYRLASTVSGYAAGTSRLRFTGTTTVNGAGRTANGSYIEKMTAAVGNNTFVVLGDASFAGSYDDVIMFAETGSCAPQGVWDYYALPLNGSGIEGPASGPLNVTII